MSSEISKYTKTNISCFPSCVEAREKQNKTTKQGNESKRGTLGRGDVH
jgi:hypothetical protein